MGHARTVTLLLLAALLASCASLPPGFDVPRTRSFALAHPEATRIGRRLAEPVRAHNDDSGFRLLPVGLDGFLTRVQMVNAAERTLDIQYYIFQADDTGQLLLRAILDAADRGVRVRLLLDDSDSSERRKDIIALDAHPNIEVRLFNPFAYRGNVPFFRALEFLANASRLDYRMHNKLFVADNAIALVGGRNIGDEYFQVSPKFEFGDYDVFVAGPLVSDLSASFDDFWNSKMTVPSAALNGAATSRDLEDYRTALDMHWQSMKDSGFVQRAASGEPLASLLSGRAPLVWARGKVLYDSPDKARVENGEEHGYLIAKQLLNVVKSVQSEVLIVPPYFVPGEKGLARLRELRSRNVRIRVLTNSLESTDVVAAHAGYSHYRPELLKEGIELYEMRAELANPRGSGTSMHLASAGRYALHAKVLVFDQRRLFIGSMNVDRRSLRLNTEIGLLIDSPELAAQVAARFEAIAQPANSYVVQLRRDGPGLIWHTEEDGRLVDHETEPARTAKQRLQLTFFSLLRLDDEL